MEEKEKKLLVSSVGPVNECFTLEEPECSDIELIACMEVVKKRKKRKKLLLLQHSTETSCVKVIK